VFAAQIAPSTLRPPVARVCAALHPAWSVLLLHVAAFAWAAAFIGFAAAFGPFLIGKRVAAKPV
jgi:uncharacterized protein involved in response to NO